MQVADLHDAAQQGHWGGEYQRGEHHAPYKLWYAQGVPVIGTNAVCSQQVSQAEACEVQNQDLEQQALPGDIEGFDYGVKLHCAVSSPAAQLTQPVRALRMGAAEGELAFSRRAILPRPHR